MALFARVWACGGGHTPAAALARSAIAPAHARREAPSWRLTNSTCSARTWAFLSAGLADLQ